MFRRSLFALALVAACSGSHARDARFPRRAPGCPLAIYGGLPTAGPWDDIGVAQVDCYLDESEIACLSRLHTEACRMGGDIIYNVPAKALRPVERGMVYRAQVAHTRATNKKDEPSAASDTGVGPIVPLPKAAATPSVPAPAAPLDGGAGSGTGTDAGVAQPAAVSH
jgi:hypothetical protein